VFVVRLIRSAAVDSGPV